MDESSAQDLQLFLSRPVLVTILVVGLLVLGVALLVTCEPGPIITIAPNGQRSVSCSYPFQGYGQLILYFAALLGILDDYLLTQLRALRGTRVGYDYRVGFGFVAVG